MNNELVKRIITSFFLVLLLSLAFFYSYILIVFLIIISIISWFEFNSLILKIYEKNKLGSNFFKLLIKALSLFYIMLFSILVFNGINRDIFILKTLYLFGICIFSDIGGFVFGKIFKGRRLTIISPNKTISGSIGSFILSLVLVPIFYYFLPEKFNNAFELIILTIIVSLSC